MELDLSSISKAVGEMQKMIGDGKTHAEKAYDFRSFKAKNTPFRFAAIDGSNHSIKGTNFIFTTLRAGYEIYDSGKLIEENVDAVSVELIANNKDRDLGFMNKFEKYYQEIVGDLPERYPDFEKTPERIRTLLEWKKLVYLIDHLSENDVIVFDGALISGTITTNHRFFNGLSEKAREKGISLVGLSKDTSLSMDAAPVPIVLMNSSQIHHPNKNWYVEYKPGTYFVRFTKLKDLIFRLDAVVPSGQTIEDILSKIADYCFDDATIGYPYPMQNIHDAVRIDQLQKDECFNIFKEEFLKNGDEQTFEQMFEIYHDELDKMSFGR